MVPQDWERAVSFNEPNERRGHETMPGMDAAEEELRALRARAYGPNPDIADDAAALSRLQELESLRTASRSTMTGPDAAAAAPHPEVSDPDVEPGPEFAALFPAPVEPTASSEGVADPQLAAGPKRYRRRTLWFASATAAALAAGVTYGAVSFLPVSASSGSPQIATLEPTTGIEVPGGFIGAIEDSPVFEFYGLTFFLSSGFNAPSTPDAACLTAVTTDQIPTAEDVTEGSWSVDGYIYSGCEAGAFPATVEVPINSEAPARLKARYPEATAFQFVLDGDRVGVFLDSD